MAAFEFKSRTDFQKMVDAQIEETLTLEYKASPALSRNSREVAELCKDVSAMANSAGGQIVYGIEEDRTTRRPVRVDDGVNDEKITREWLQQIISSNIHPRIDRVSVERIELSVNKFGFVISVEPTINGPHQAPYKKYYKRFELEAKPMEDYEIRDILGRSLVQISPSISSSTNCKKHSIALLIRCRTSSASGNDPRNFQCVKRAGAIRCSARLHRCEAHCAHHQL